MAMMLEKKNMAPREPALDLHELLLGRVVGIEDWEDKSRRHHDHAEHREKGNDPHAQQLRHGVHSDSHEPGRREAMEVLVHGVVGYVLRVTGYGLWVMGYGLWVMG